MPHYVTSRDIKVTGVTVNHGKIPDGEGYCLSFNYHAVMCGEVHGW